jgi:hypothetical protein
VVDFIAFSSNVYLSIPTMKNRIGIFTVFVYFVFAISTAQTMSLVDPKGTTLSTRFNAPANYMRVSNQETSFASYLNKFPLKKHGTEVFLYNGNEKNRQDVHAAVLEISVGNKDLQQCADAVMRLRAEYLYQTKQYSKLHFNFTNGFKADYSKWMQGYRIKVKGNKCSWYLAGKPTTSRETFNAYLEMVFSYAGTLSLSKELKKKSLNDIQVGDVFVFGGSPGHAVIVMDVAIHFKSKERIFMLAQSYMPAQNIHVLKNFNESDISPWYRLKEDQTLKTPEWDFLPGSLYTFE